MANAVYRSSSSTRKNRDHERIRGNARLTSVESEARALLLARNDDTKEQNNVAPPPPLSAPSSPTPHEAASPTADAAPTSQMTSSGKANAKTADHTEEHVITAHAKAEQKEQEKTSARIRVKETRPGGRKKEVPQHRENSGGWALQLTPSLVLMLVVFELVTLSFFFLFGLIIGKGTVPPPPQAELERILPTEENRTERTQEILPQEELRFMANLKADESATERQQPAAAPNLNPKKVKTPYLLTTAISMILSFGSRRLKVMNKPMLCAPAWKAQECVLAFNAKKPRKGHGALS